MNVIQELEKIEADRLLSGKTIPQFQAGDTVRVNVKIKEGERERVQAYEGVCIARSGGGFNTALLVGGGVAVAVGVGLAVSGGSPGPNDQPASP
jgi:ribosomal protein L19